MFVKHVLLKKNRAHTIINFKKSEYIDKQSIIIVHDKCLLLTS